MGIRQLLNLVRTWHSNRSKCTSTERLPSFLKNWKLVSWRSCLTCLWYMSMTFFNDKGKPWVNIPLLFGGWYHVLASSDNRPPHGEVKWRNRTQSEGALSYRNLEVGALWHGYGHQGIFACSWIIFIFTAIAIGHQETDYNIPITRHSGQSRASTMLDLLLSCLLLLFLIESIADARGISSFFIYLFK